MGIDYVVDYPCVPKQQLTTEGIIQRLKLRDQTQQVIKLYRDQGDHRPLEEIGFEMTRRAANGTEETQLIVAADALKEVETLQELAAHCAECPANAFGQAYGCMGSIHYPIAYETEVWMMQQLPSVANPGLLLMLFKAVQEFGYTGASAQHLREQEGVFFETDKTLVREYAEVAVTSDIVFEMTFQLGPIQPAHGIMLLLFYRAIPHEDLGAEVVMNLMKHTFPTETFEARFPFLLSMDTREQQRSPSLVEIKRFLKALYVAYRQNVALWLDL